MQKKTILLFLSLLLVLTSCTSIQHKSAESSNTTPLQKDTPAKNTLQELTTKSSINTTNPQGTVPENNSNKNEAIEDPTKEALTKILTELQELDELLNRTD